MNSCVTKVFTIFIAIIVMIQPAASEICLSDDVDVHGHCKTLLEFQGDIAGAAVFLDGKPEDASRVIETSPGKHNIEIYKDGHIPYIKSVEVKLDQKTVVSVILPLRPPRELEAFKKVTPVKQQSIKSGNCPAGMVPISGVVFWMGSPLTLVSPMNTNSIKLLCRHTASIRRRCR